MIESASTLRLLTQNHFNRMGLAGGDPTLTQRQALSKLLVDLNVIGFDKIKRVMPYMGGTAACHALEIFGNDVTWGGTVTHNSNGITGNGSNGYGLMPLDPNTDLGESDMSISAYVRNTPKDAGMFAGTYYALSGNERFYLGTFGNSMAGMMQNNDFTGELCPPSSSPLTRGAMFLSSSITTAKAVETWSDGVSVGTTTTSGNSPEGPNMGILCVVNNNSSTRSNYTDANVAFQHWGTHLNDANQVLLYAAVQAFQTTLGRQI